MDRKTVLLLVASFGALFLWQFLVNVWFPPTPKAPAATNIVASATNTFATNGLTAMATAAPPALTAATTNQPIAMDPRVPETLEVLESPEAIITITSRGGGVKQVQLKGFLETVGCDRASGTNLFATLNDR